MRCKKIIYSLGDYSSSTKVHKNLQPQIGYLQKKCHENQETTLQQLYYNKDNLPPTKHLSIINIQSSESNLADLQMRKFIKIMLCQ